MVFPSGKCSLKCLDKPCVPPTEEEVAVVAALKVAREVTMEDTKLLPKSMTIESRAHTVAASLLNWLARGICLTVSNL